MEKKLIDFLKMNDVEYKENICLSSISPIKIGGCAWIVAYPNSEEKLIRLACFLENEKIKYKILGRMSNVLPPDESYEGVIIRTDKFCDLKVDGSSITASAGAPLAYIAGIACKNGLSGLEELSGIPGSIGGCIIGNAGAFGREIAELISSVAVYCLDSKSLVCFSPDECGFEYRYSHFRGDRYIVLSATLSLAYGDPLIIRRRMDEFKQRRLRTQPTDKPSLGSCFKRVSADLSAARLIDECGLKGKGFGGAMISDKHAGFIVNTGGATAYDYITLSDFAAAQVYEKYAIRIEREVEIIQEV